MFVLTFLKPCKLVTQLWCSTVAFVYCFLRYVCEVNHVLLFVSKVVSCVALWLPISSHNIMFCCSLPLQLCQTPVSHHHFFVLYFEMAVWQTNTPLSMLNHFTTPASLETTGFCLWSTRQRGDSSAILNCSITAR